MKKFVCVIILLLSMLSARAQWIHSPIWRIGGNPVVSSIAGVFFITYNSTDYRLLLPVTDGEIPNAATKRAWRKWSWWWPFFNYETPIAIGPNIKWAGEKVDIKSLSTIIGSLGYQFGYFPKGVLPIGGRVKFMFQSEVFALKMPGEEEYFCNLKNSIVPSGDVFVRVGNYVTKHFNAIILGGMEYNKTLSYQKKQWEKIKIFSFKSNTSEFKYENQDKDILNSGFTGNFGAGIINTRTGRMITIMYQKDFFKFFNNDYVSDDGNKPYKDVKSNNGYISVNICFVP